MFIGGRSHSLANPLFGPAYATNGLKPTDNYAAYSVGTKGIDHVTRANDGSMPTAVIEGSVITFSVSQIDPSIIIGDLVTLDSTAVILNKKISRNSWRVTDTYGEFADDASGSVISIDRLFSTIGSALTGAALNGTNLISKDICAFISCSRVGGESFSANVDVDGWLTDENHFVKIFSPNDIEFDCNARNSYTNGLKHGYYINNSVFSIRLISNYCQIEGLSFNCGSVAIVASAYSKVISNYFRAGTDQIQATNNCVIINNIMERCSGTSLIVSGANNLIANNTVVGGLVGIDTSTTPGNRVVNCICNVPTIGGSKDYNPESSDDLINCLSKDATATGTGCLTGITVKFYGSDDFRLHEGNVDSLRSAGFDVSSDAYFPFNFDFLNKKIEGTWGIGAHHYIREAHIAIDGGMDTPIPMPGNIAVSRATATFSEPQTSTALCSGVKIETSGDEYMLKRKISDTEWVVTTINGSMPNDTASTAIVTANAQYNTMVDMANAIPSIIGSNLTAVEVKVVVQCIRNTIESSPSLINVLANSTYNLTIKSPESPEECNASYRHIGKLDQALYVVTQDITINETLPS